MALLPRSRTPFERRLGYRFRSRELLERALTHRSFANEQNLPRNNERLEFLGDSVLGLVTVEWLFAEHPEVSEGELSKIKSRLVSAPVLARAAGRLGLGEHLRLGIGEERSGGRDKPSLLADAMEAIIGAVFLDGGFKAARRLVRPIVAEALAERQGRIDHAKSRLQELAQARGWPLPSYRLVEERGPDHRKTFRVDCLVRGETAGTGEGRSKKRAESQAAAAALRRLEASAGGEAADRSAGETGPAGDAPPH